MSVSASTLAPAPEQAGEGSVQADLCRFAARMLEECGGAVEWDRPAEAGTAVIPPQAARLLGVDEMVPLALRQERGALCISLASEFLDQSEQVLESLIPRVGAFCVPDHYLKGGDLQTAIDRRFTWHNARVRVRGSAPQLVEYHTWWFFASLKSEDVWESRLNVTINAASRAPVEMPDLLSLTELDPCLEPAAASPEDTFDAAVRWAQAQLLEDAGPFITRMESRLERDRKRLRDYYGALKREAGSTRRRTAAPPSPEELEARKRAVNLELARKLDELSERYQMEASLEPITLICLQANVLAVELSVQRKRAERTHHIHWNPLTKQFEPLCCFACGQATFSAAFTDDDVSLLCAACHASSDIRGGTTAGAPPTGGKQPDQDSSLERPVRSRV